MTGIGNTLSPVGRILLRRRAALTIAFVGGGVATLLLSPLLLLLVSVVVPQSDSYAMLSAIGQSFTGISAVLSAFALGALAYTSRLQARQATISAIQAARSAQFDLSEKAMNDPELAAVLGQKVESQESFKVWRVSVYRNMWFMYMQMLFRTEELSEAGLRRILSLELFTSSDGLYYWQSSRVAFAADLTDIRGQRFIEIVDEEALKAQPLFAAQQDDSTVD